jgi:hypothetical protein
MDNEQLNKGVHWLSFMVGNAYQKSQKYGTGNDIFISKLWT